MKLLNIIKLSFFVLRSNRVRTLLTGLGIIIGIAAVIVIISAGSGAQSLITNQLNSLGTNLIGILPGSSNENGAPASALGVVVNTLKYEDAEAIAKQVPNVVAVSSYNIGIANISWQGNNYDTNFNGVMADYPQVEDTEVAQGRFFSSEEDNASSKVAVLGSQIAEELFKDQSPLGQRIKINKEFFEVIGFMKPRGTVGFQNRDKLVFIPAKTAQKIMLGINHVNLIRVKINSPENIDAAAEDIRLLLRDRHDLKESTIDDFSVRNTKDAIKTLNSITDALKFFLAAIAGISLIVGGVGVMNIMLASVNQRIREIGLRKAVGAKKIDIMIQFLAESVILTLLAGVIGVIIGCLISILIALIANYLGYKWSLIISPLSIFIGFLLAFFVGIIFGLYPAQKAAKLNSIEALRYE